MIASGWKRDLMMADIRERPGEENRNMMNPKEISRIHEEKRERRDDELVIDFESCR